MISSSNILVGPLRVQIEQHGVSVPLAGNYLLDEDGRREADVRIQVEFSSDFAHDCESAAEYPAFACRSLDDFKQALWRADAKGTLACPSDGPITATFEGLAKPHTLEAVIRLATSVALPRKDALILHSSAVEDDEGCHVFSGVSGAGKSTIAALLEENFSLRRLSDELLLLVRNRGKWQLEVAPFTGKVTLPWGAVSPLRSINFLVQASTNDRRLLSPTRAMGELSRHVVTYAHDPLTLGLVLDLVGDIVESIPCYELKFRNSPSVAEALNLSCS
tara:strand:- start:28433 stop:29260 length:828 start_codon:yes stop_codon:yes gene_type:complete